MGARCFFFLRRLWQFRPYSINRYGEFYGNLVQQLKVGNDSYCLEPDVSLGQGFIDELEASNLLGKELGQHRADGDAAFASSGQRGADGGRV